MEGPGVELILRWLSVVFLVITSPLFAETKEELRAELAADISKMESPAESALYEFALGRWDILEAQFEYHRIHKGDVEAVLVALEKVFPTPPPRARQSAPYLEHLARRYFARFHVGGFLKASPGFVDLRRFYECTWNFRDVVPLVIHEGLRSDSEIYFRYWAGEMLAADMSPEATRQMIRRYRERFGKDNDAFFSAMTSDLEKYVGRGSFEPQQLFRARVTHAKLMKVATPVVFDRLENLGRLLLCLSVTLTSL